MFRNPFTKALFNNTRKSFQTKVMNPTSFTYKPQANFGRYNRFFNNLQRPLHHYLVGANLVVYLAGTFYDEFTRSQAANKSERFDKLLIDSFSHINFTYMLINMVGIYAFGRFIEIKFGPKVLLNLYLAGALLAGLMIYSDSIPLVKKEIEKFVSRI